MMPFVVSWSQVFSVSVFLCSAIVLWPDRPHQGVYLPVPHVLQAIRQAAGPCWAAEGSRYVLNAKLRVQDRHYSQHHPRKILETCLQEAEELLLGKDLSFLERLVWYKNGYHLHWAPWTFSSLNEGRLIWGARKWLRGQKQKSGLPFITRKLLCRTSQPSQFTFSV